MSFTTVQMNYDVFKIDEQKYKNILDYSTRVNEKGEREIDWTQVTELVERTGKKIGKADPFEEL